MRHIPNILSALRILMVGVFVYLFVQQAYLWALGVYALAFVTDIVDGYLARRNNWITNVGKVLDPLADKLLLIAALTCFYLEGWIPLWLLIVVVAKELVMIVGGALLWKKNVVVYADWFGKIATGLFNLGVVMTICKNFWAWIADWNIIVLAIAMVLTVIAMLHYGKRTLFHKYEKNAAENDGGENEA